MSNGPVIALEQFVNEVHASAITSATAQALKEGRSVQTILSPLYEVHLPEVAQLMELFKPSLPYFLGVKRKIIDLQKWLDGVKKGCQGEGASLLAEAEAALSDRLLLINAHIPAVHAGAREGFVTDYRGSLERAAEEMEGILEQRLAPEQWRAFNQVTKQQLSVLGALAAEQQELHLQVLLQEARSLYLTRFPNLHFSLLCSWTGALYVVMDVSGQMLGNGAIKAVTRTVELKTGTIFALVKPQILFLNAKDEKEKLFLRRQAFIQTWRESDFLLQLQGTPGVVSILERIPFQVEGVDHLFLVEERYEDGTLEAFFSEVIDKRVQMPGYEEIAVSLALQLLSRLNQLHSLWVVHRDIKAFNILCDWRDPSYKRAVLCDFNAACTLLETEIQKKEAFSAFYAAPEYLHAYMQVHSKEEALAAATSCAIDIWSMGIILYQLFFLERLPWYREGVIENDEETIREVYSRLRTLEEGWIPKKFTGHRFYPLIQKMLQIDPEQRINAKKALEECQKLV